MASEQSALGTSPQIAATVAQPTYLALAGAFVIIAAACLVYYPAMSGGFLWDDDVLLTNNRLIYDPYGWLHVWSFHQPVDYWPVSNLSLWLEFRLWGMNSTGYHITNLVLHLGVSLLTWVVLRQLKVPGAFLAALVFAVHPVNVESVAWIAQRKTLLASLFGVLSVHWYLKADADRNRRLSDVAVWPWYALGLTAFLLAMLSKASIAPLPAVLLLIAWWAHDRITLRDVARAAPFFLIAAVLVLVNMKFQASNGATRAAPFLERLAGAGAIPWFYLYKAMLPVHLIFIYPQWEIHTEQLRWWLPLGATIGATALLLRFRHTRWGRPLLFAWAYFLLMLVPVLGFTDITFMNWSLVADHYQYSAILGVIALVAAALTTWQLQSRDAQRFLAIAVAAALVAVLMTLSWLQTGTYIDTETHWRTTIERNPECYVAHNNLGILLLNSGRQQEAIERFQDALRIQPGFSEAHGNLSLALVQLGKSDEAIQHATEAVRLNPNFGEAHSNLANLLLGAGRVAEAIEEYQEAARLNPFNPLIQSNLGSALLQAGRSQEAAKHFEEAIRLIPDAGSPDSLQRQTADRAGQLQAIARNQQVVQQAPDSAEARFNLGNALVKSGALPEAIAHFEQALKLRPEFAEAHLNLAGALVASGRPADALEHCRAAVRLKPELVEAQYNLGIALLVARNTDGAVEHLQETVRLRPDYAEAWANLAVAQAKLNRSAAGITSGVRALELARSQGKTTLAAQIEAWLATQK